MADIERNKDADKDPRGARAVQRWLYVGLAGLILVFGATYLYRADFFESLLGTADEAGPADRASETSRDARKNFRSTVDALSDSDQSIGKLTIPTDINGFFAPPSDDEIPDDQSGESIRRGREIFLNPGANATEYVGNSLACANCHLDIGRRANSAPMWAAAGMYPVYRGKNKRINTMEDRMEGCFTYSMDAPSGPAGHSPPEGHEIYKDLENYFHWLATGAPNRVSLPGAGYPTPDEPEGGYDLVRGEKVFEAQCAVCHGSDGQGRYDRNGRNVFPPLWGPESYNWGAGMHRVNTAAGFIHANMPLGLPYSLTPQEAWDAAAYINSHERPADPRQPGENLTVAEAKELYHNHPDYYGQEIRGKVIGGGFKVEPKKAPSDTGTVLPEQ